MYYTTEMYKYQLINIENLRILLKKDRKREENSLTYFIRKRIINVSAFGAESAVSKNGRTNIFIGGDNDESEFKTCK